MKKIILLSFLFFGFLLSHALGQQNIQLPEVKAKAGMDVIQAMETRAASRSFDTKAVPIEAISTILWAGNGIILRKGSKTIHGYDAVTSATNLYRYTTPWGWGDPYIKLYLILKEGTYEYLPREHELRFISDNGKSGGTSAFGVIVIAVDFNEMPGFNKDVKNVAFLSAGSAAQNMYVAGAVYNIQMLTQVSINKKRIKKQLDLPDKVEPLATLTFGHAS